MRRNVLKECPQQDGVYSSQRRWDCVASLERPTNKNYFVLVKLRQPSLEALIVKDAFQFAVVLYGMFTIRHVCIKRIKHLL